MTTVHRITIWRIIGGILLFVIGFPIALASGIFGILGMILAGISNGLRYLFVRLCGLNDD